MKPSLQQTLHLKKYLRDTLNYRETCEEIYDHILTAAEHKPDDTSFEVAVNDILKHDFGGAKGLVNIEKKLHRSAVWEVVKIQWNLFTEFLYPPKLLFTIIFLIVISAIVSMFGLSSYVIMGYILTLSVTPGIFVLIRYYRIGYFFQDTKKSIRDRIFMHIAGKPLLIFNSGMFILLYNSKLKIWIDRHQAIIIVVLLLTTLYVLAFVKLCLTEFKTYILSK